MACACGKSASTKVWIYTSRDGSETREYTSEIQARAAVVRAGGGRVSSRDK
jgi:hypothetical protein